jgi:hypothetical protein
MTLFGYIKGISPDQYGVHAHCNHTNIGKIPPMLCDVREPHSCQKKLVVRESSWVKQFSVDKMFSPTSLKVSDYFSDYLSEHFSEYLMHILTNKSGKICINCNINLLILNS